MSTKSISSELVTEACVEVIDGLFDDIHYIRETRSLNFGATSQLHRLPAQSRSQYTLGFAKRFLVSAVEVSASVLTGDRLPRTIAEELAAKLIIDETTSLAAEREVRFDSGDWYERTFEDLDVEWLYDERRAPLSGYSSDANSWFAPFRPDEVTSAYTQQRVA